MRWLAALALVVASAIIVPALLRQSEAATPDRLDRIHESAAF